MSRSRSAAPLPAAAVPPACVSDPVTGHCSVCADEAIEARILSISADRLARAEVGGAVREIALDLLDGVAVGDRVLVHAGVAISHLETDRR